MNTLCRFTKVINLGYGMTNLGIHSSIAHSSSTMFIMNAIHLAFLRMSLYTKPELQQVSSHFCTVGQVCTFFYQSFSITAVSQAMPAVCRKSKVIQESLKAFLGRKKLLSAPKAFTSQEQRFTFATEAQIFQKAVNPVRKKRGLAGIHKSPLKSLKVCQTLICGRTSQQILEATICHWQRRTTQEGGEEPLVGVH